MLQNKRCGGRYLNFVPWAVILLMAFMTGCATIMQDIPPSHPDFFACNYWVDRNQDNKIDDDEWDGIKNDFRSTEHICFVGYFRHKEGTNLTFRLFAPDGSLCREKNLKQKAKVSVWCQEYEAKELVNYGGTGVWSVKWFVEGQLVNITVIRILPH
ncbi:MAG TPA: hypothetical protein PLS78_02790 [bacterium]|nr:hypothetical protein [bacterium]